MHYRLSGLLTEAVKRVKQLHTEIRGRRDVIHPEDLKLCQQSAIDMGEAMEAQGNEYGDAVAMLEEYCELVYEFSNSADWEILDRMDKKLDELSAYILRLPVKYRVVFLPYKADMWDSLESIWRAFREDERFLCDVVPIPYFEANARTKEWEFRYDGERFPADVPIVKYNQYHLAEMKPDLAFIHNPFDKFNYVTSVYPDYYSWELKKTVLKLVYVPYYVNTGFISDDYQDLPALEIADHIIVQSQKAKDSCKEKGYYDRILPLGSPKADRIAGYLKKGREIMPSEWREVAGDRKIVLLNTTINELLSSEMKLIDKLREVFEYLRGEERVLLVWRPHPLLEATVKAMRPQLADRYRELVAYYMENRIGIYDTSGDATRAVTCADGYIGSSYSSIIVMCMIAGKPIFLFNREESVNCDMVQNDKDPMGFMLQDHVYTAIYETADYTLGNFINDILKDRLDELSARELERVHEYVANADGTCGQKVHDVLTEILEKELRG